MPYNVEIGYRGRFQRRPTASQMHSFSTRQAAERYAYNATRRGHAVSVDRITASGQRGLIVAGYKGRAGGGLKNFGSFKQIDTRVGPKRRVVRRVQRPRGFMPFGGF